LGKTQNHFAIFVIFVNLVPQPSAVSEAAKAIGRGLERLVFLRESKRAACRGLCRATRAGSCSTTSGRRWRAASARFGGAARTALSRTSSGAPFAPARKRAGAGCIGTATAPEGIG